MALRADQVVLYIILPIIAVLVAILVVWICHKKRVCWYYRNDEALLPSNDQKNRITIDLSRRSDSIMSEDTEESYPQMGLKRKRESAKDSRQKNDYISFDNEKEKKHSGNIQIPSLSIPIHKPEVRQAAAIGQAQHCKTHLNPASLNPHLKRRSLGLILEHSTLQPSDSSDQDDQNSDNCITRHSDGGNIKLRHSLSEPATSPKPQNQTEIQINGKDFNSSNSGMNSIMDFVYQRKLSHQKPIEDSRIVQIKTDSPDHGMSDSSETIENGVHSSEQDSPVLTVPAGRRRSSMQLPIDFRQINPELYTNVTRMASVESDDTSDGQPLIHFTLTYDEDLEVLTVKLIQARCLPTLDSSNISDPYCIVTLLPGANLRKSRIHKQTNNPEFEETFTFSASTVELKNKILEIRSFEYDQFSRDECTGVMKINLEQLDFDLVPKYDLWKKFKPVLRHRPSQDGQSFGDLMLALSYLPSAEKLTVVIQKARGLKFTHKKHTHESHVKVYLCKEGQRIKKKTTSTSRGSSSPVFNQAITFTVPPSLLYSKEVYLAFVVAEEGILQSKETIGSLEIGPKCENEDDRQHWNEIIKKSNHKAIARWHKLQMPRRMSSPDNNPLEFLQRVRRDSAASK